MDRPKERSVTIMPEPRPIDKSKPSNHRCINCTEWDKATKLPTRHWSDPEKHCDTANKDINYWNRCKHFQWNPNKLYKEEE